MLLAAGKGIFLIGVLSWYSAAIFGMINNYFLNEFKEYLKKNPIDPVQSPAKSLPQSRTEIAKGAIEPAPPAAADQRDAPSNSKIKVKSAFGECNETVNSELNGLNVCCAADNARYSALMKSLHQCDARFKEEI